MTRIESFIYTVLLAICFVANLFYALIGGVLGISSWPFVLGTIASVIALAFSTNTVTAHFDRSIIHNPPEYEFLTAWYSFSIHTSNNSVGFDWLWNNNSFSHIRFAYSIGDWPLRHTTLLDRKPKAPEQYHMVTLKCGHIQWLRYDDFRNLTPDNYYKIICEDCLDGKPADDLPFDDLYTL